VERSAERRTRRNFDGNCHLTVGVRTIRRLQCVLGLWLKLGEHVLVRGINATDAFQLEAGHS
jgi:hypothetical protein